MFWDLQATAYDSFHNFFHLWPKESIFFLLIIKIRILFASKGLGGWVRRWCWVASSAGAPYYFGIW